MESSGNQYHRETLEVPKWLRNRYGLFDEMGGGLSIREHKATTVASVLLENCFTRLGMPEEIISNEGAEFEGEMFTKLCKSLNVSILRTRPSINGMVEWYHRTLSQMLGKVVGETQRDWDLHVPAAAAAYRASEHVETGFAPNFMMLGREVRAPVDIVLGAPAGEEEF